ncbi:ferritin [Geomonas sp. Red32]|uniref:ferritin family protein n=1 Tax=Geomonas sp. Red32 TaxID=2912856 RepID=UPI00202CBBD6|nr:ferritin family protein [Geomonas sp. Red32]MCM0083727.1 ferritin [Geomonas sp. Red32]
MTPKDVVLSKEGDGKGRYERFSALSPNPEVSRIFTMISEDEARHAEALRALEAAGKVDLPNSRTLDGARPLLHSLRSGKRQRFRYEKEEYLAALDFEAASARHLWELAREATHVWERELLIKMAEEDEVHFTLLEQIGELLVQPEARIRNEQ